MALQIALWGPSGAGKTAFLAQLYLKYTEPPWQIVAIGKESLEFLDLVRSCASKNQFPAATVAGAKDIVTYCFKNERAGDEFHVTLTDRPGQELTDLGDEVQDTLAKANGLLFLFGCADSLSDVRLQADKALAWQHTLAGRGADRDKRPIAFCFSKADLLIHDVSDLNLARTEPHKFCSERVGFLETDLYGEPVGTLSSEEQERLMKELSSMIERYGACYRFFPVSAAGFGLGNDARSTVFFDERLEIRLSGGGQALNLIEPFEWIASELGHTGGHI